MQLVAARELLQKQRSVSIPQAVSTVATVEAYDDEHDIKEGVSIPQAVSTVATPEARMNKPSPMACFNTASGKHCCN